MTFSNLSPSVVAMGAIAFALTLFALQFLRPRIKVVKVATSLFWQQARQQAPVKTLWQRFRYPLAWLLALLIVMAIWLALAGITTTAPQTTTKQFFYLDGSAGMQAGQRFANAKARLQADLEQVYGQQSEVWFGGATVSLIATGGNSSALLKNRLETLVPQTSLMAFNDFATQIAERFSDDTTIAIQYYGQLLSDEKLALLPSNVMVETRFTPQAIPANWGVVNLGYRMAASGDAQYVDITVEIAGNTATQQAPEIAFTLNGVPFQPGDIVQNSTSTWLLLNIPLSQAPQTFSAAVTSSDKFLADNVAKLTLPAVTQIPVYLGKQVPPIFGVLLSADESLTAVTSKADVAICVVGDDNCMSQSPRILLLSSDTSALTFVYVTDSVDEGAAITQLWQMRGWADAGATLSFDVVKGEQRKVILNQARIASLISEQDRRLPLILTHSLRWLAQDAALPQFAAVGEPMTDVANNPVALSATEMTLGNKMAVDVSLLNRNVTAAVSQPSSTQKVATITGRSAEIWPWLILLALLAIVAEWWGIVRGKLP